MENKFASEHDLPPNPPDAAAAANAAAADAHREIPALDGLRAVAVLGVILVHINSQWLPGGFMGVDVFFVISGFLITGIIHRDLREGTFSFKEFYLRRVQRLLPNACLVIAATVLAFLVFFQFGPETQAGTHGVWTLLNFSNFYIYSNLGDYWGESAENAPFTHFWSLGIEEQFYLLFPLFLFLLFRFLRRKNTEKSLKWILVFFAVLSFAAGFRMTFHNPTAAFYLPHFRFWELLAGAALALHLKPFLANQKPRAGAEERGILGLMGISFVLVSYFAFTPKSAFPGWFVLLPVLGSALVIYSITANSPILTRFFSLPPIVRIGRYSYSLYLWHWPAIIIGKRVAERFFISTQTASIAGAILGAVCAIGAYHLIESPLRRRGAGRKRRIVILLLMFGTAMSLSLYTASKPPGLRIQFDPVYGADKLYEKTGYHFVPSHDSAKHEPEVRARLRRYDFGPSEGIKNVGKSIRAWLLQCGVIRTREPVAMAPIQMSDNDANFVAPQSAGELFGHGFVKRYAGGKTPRVLLLGNSHALHHAWGLDRVCWKLKIDVAFSAVPRSMLFPSARDETAYFPYLPDDQLQDRARAVVPMLKNLRPELLFMAERWDLYDAGKLEYEIEKFLIKVKDSKLKVVLVTQIPAIEHRTQNLFLLINSTAKDEKNLPHLPPDYRQKRREEIVAGFERICRRNPHVSLLRMDHLFTKPDGNILYAIPPRFFYLDDNHLSITGSEHSSHLFEKIITTVLLSPPSTPATP